MRLNVTDMQDDYHAARDRPFASETSGSENRRLGALGLETSHTVSTGCTVGSLGSSIDAVDTNHG